MTTTLSVIRTAVRPNPPGFSLDLLVDATEQILTSKLTAPVDVILLRPPNVTIDNAAKYDGNRFRIVRTAQMPSVNHVTFIYGDSVVPNADLRKLSYGQWAEFVWTAAGLQWRLVAAGAL